MIIWPDFLLNAFQLKIIPPETNSEFTLENWPKRPKQPLELSGVNYTRWLRFREATCTTQMLHVWNIYLHSA